MRTSLAVLAWAAAVMLASSVASAREAAAQPATAYEAELGPELPGGAGCPVNMMVLGSGAGEGALLGLPQWYASLRAAVSAGNSAKATDGIARLCGGRYRPNVIAFHAVVPEPSSPAAKALEVALATLKASCEASDALKYTNAFFTVCPTPGSLGPAMPERCDALVADPREGEDSHKTLRLPLFLTVLRDVVDQSGEVNDEAWRRGMKGLCGRREGVSGVGFHTHRPLTGTPLHADVSKRVASLVEACGGAELDAELYKVSWEALCPASPTTEVVSLEETQRAEALSGAVQRYRAAVEAAKLLGNKAEAMSVAAEAGGGAHESVLVVGKRAQSLLKQLKQWEDAEADREPTFEKSCDAA